MDRLTYKSRCGDYGGEKEYPDTYSELCALRNKLGKFEDDDWRSIKEDGQPMEKGVYFVTFVSSNGRRYACQCVFDGQKWISTNTPIAWRPPLKPYEGE